MAAVLIVEDEVQLRRSLTLNLVHRGYTVAEADSVETAIEALEAFTTPFDVILLDINLPDETGWDVLRFLREQRRGATCETGESSDAPARQRAVALHTSPSATSKVIVMTAVRPAQRRRDEFHPVAVLLKPFPLDTLLRLIERTLLPVPALATRRGRDSAPDTSPRFDDAVSHDEPGSPMAPAE
ncbi:MAG: response regulator [Ktedonobacterales bacterium]